MRDVLHFAKEVKDEAIRMKILDYFSKKDADLNDTAIHAFADELKMNPHDFEGEVYKTLASFAQQGKMNAAGKSPDDFDKKEMALGEKVEMEHTNSLAIARRISSDHLTEAQEWKNPDYYSGLKVFEDLMKAGVTIDQLKSLTPKKASKTAGLEKHLEMKMNDLGFKHKSVDWEVEYDNAGKPVLTVEKYNEKKYKELAQKLKPDFNAKFVKDHLVLLPVKQLFGRKASVETDFQEKMDDILESVEDAIQLVRNSGDKSAYERAKSYWYAHIKGAVDKGDSGYLGGSMVDMAETLKEISGSLDDELISRYKAELKKHGIGISKVEKDDITLEVLPDANITDESILVEKAYEIAEKVGINPDVGIDF